MATLKLRVMPEVFANLFKELSKSPNKLQINRHVSGGDILGTVAIPAGFVKILPGDRKFDGSKTEIVLDLEEEVRDDRVDGGMVPVDREAIDRLLDELRIYPRKTQSQTRPELPEHIKALAEEVQQGIETLFRTHNQLDRIVRTAELEKLLGNYLKFMKWFEAKEK